MFLALNSNRYQNTVERRPGKGLFRTEREAQEGQQLRWDVRGAEAALQSWVLRVLRGQAGRDRQPTAQLSGIRAAQGVPHCPRFSRIMHG